MARPATGTIIEDTRGDSRRYGARFPAYGKKRFAAFGSSAEGWTRPRAEQELANILADVRRGIWRPDEPEPVAAPRDVPTFHEYASEWFERRKLEGGRRMGGLSAAGVADLSWRLTYHLLPFFAKMRLDEIRIEDVDRFRFARVRERDAIEKAAAAGKPLMEDYTDPRTGRTRQRRRTALGPVSINKLIGTLSAILEAACEVDLVPRNVAGGRRRRLASVTPPRTTLDSAEHIAALLDAAGSLDGLARCRHGQRRALVATLVFAGLRISEALSLRWSDVDLARGTVKVRQGKTDAAARTVNLLPVLRDELSSYAARVLGSPDAIVFATTTGGQQSPSNVRRRVLAKVRRDSERTTRQGERGTDLSEADAAQLASNVCQHPVRDRRARTVRDEPARPRRPENDARRLRESHEPTRRRTGAAAGSRRGRRLDSNGQQRVDYVVVGSGALTLGNKKPPR